MGINDRIEAARQAGEERLDAVNREATEAKEERRRRADERRVEAERLMPELAEGIQLLRSKQELSLRLLAHLDGPMSLARELGSGWSAAQRRKRLKTMGWEVATRAVSKPWGPRGEKAFAAYRTIIPFDGPLLVVNGEESSGRQTLERHVQDGITFVPVRVDKESTSMVEVHADKTVGALLDVLAEHLSLLDRECE